MMNGSRSGNLNRTASQSSWSRRGDNDVDDEEALMWASLEKLPTYDRLRTSIMKSFVEESSAHQGENCKEFVHKVVDVTKLDSNERTRFVERLFKVADEDNERLLKKFRDRIDKVGIQLPTVEVRFKQLVVETNVHVGTRALPTLPNVARNIMESLLQKIGINLSERTKLMILKDVSGIVRPSRMALLLGPPSSGKTTLLLELAGRLDPTLKVDGDVTYNGYGLNEFVPQKTSAYISQNDVHVGLMTVRETLGFSARCQGVGSRYELLCELARREKEAQVYPDSEVDLCMKATAQEGVESSLIVDYTLRILGLDICSDTLIGDAMLRGISGGQKKRVTTGEMIVGPAKTLFMDEISTGLDSSTTYQIVKCFQQVAHQTDATILMSLLQPAPETFELFDDIILLAEGQVVYQGPRDHVVEFFESCGFRCPERKGIADFLQEVTSKKDQWQYWFDKSKPYKYITVAEFVALFKSFHVGVRLADELSTPYDKALSHEAALVFERFSVPLNQLLKASFDKEWLLMRRNSFFYIFRAVQITVVAIIVSTVFLRNHMHTQNEEDGALYIAALGYSLIVNMLNGFTDMSMIILRLPVFFKLRNLLFHPAWTFTLPVFLLGILVSIYESIIWLGLTYYSVGYAPEASRFFKQLLLVFLIQQMAAGLFRATAGLCRTMTIASTAGIISFLIMFMLGGFVIPKGQIVTWLKWGYWLSPLTYAFNGLAVNEMLAPRWMNKLASDNTTRLGVAVLKNSDVFQESDWYWIAAAALVGYIVVFNLVFTVALTYLNPLGKPPAIILKEEACHMETDKEGTKRESRPNSRVGMGLTSSLSLRKIGLDENEGSAFEPTLAVKRGMILRFPALSMSFDSVSYFVDMPPEMKEQGVTEDRLQLLREVTAAFRPGVLTALMGVSGAGKTTLMDVLAGRKTGGYIDGDIRISGFPKKQDTFARVLGYCEQTDIHSPQVTVRESLIFSAFLRLSRDITKEQKMMFVDEVIDLVELENVKDAIVGLPGVTGLSTEQRKRLTIAVELVANPSIIFMDEPTSGLDARAAAIVMRAVRNTIETGRTVVCTIHQPSIDIFQAFDELLLMKRGGQVIYSGPLGQNSQKVIEYFEAIPGIPKIKERYNPATWMLEVSSVATEVHLGIDFAEYYKSSTLYKETAALVEQLRIPPAGAKDLYFETRYPESTWGQFQTCLLKQWWTYWRSPDYNLVRYIFTLACALIVGAIVWKIGNRRDTAKDLTVVTGVMYLIVMFVGFTNCSTVQPVVAVERTVFYRERAAGMYSAFSYAIAQVVVEIPFVFLQTVYYVPILYAMLSFQWTATKFFWFFFIAFFTFLYFTYYGMMTMAVTPNQQVAGIVSTTFFYLFHLFSGFFIPRPKIPKWWSWYYWICPVAWTLYGLITTQYGDLEQRIKVPGIFPDPTIKWYVKHELGYNPDMMGVVAAVMIAYTVLFAFFFAYCLRALHFQAR